MENEMNEFEQMKDTIRLFKEELAKQKIVNERLMSDCMKHKMSWIKKFVYIEVAVIPVLVLIIIAEKPFLGLSWWNISFCTVMICLDVFADYLINIKSVKDEDFARESLIGTIRKLQQMKHWRQIQMMVGIPLVFIWIFWCGYEILQSAAASGDNFIQYVLQSCLVGGAVGCLVGLVVFYYIYRKMQKTNESVIKDIEELVEGE